MHHSVFVIPSSNRNKKIEHTDNLKEMRNAYICVYRHAQKPKGLAKTQHNALNDPAIAEFMHRYFEDDNVLDWGDDPAFFMATKKFGNPAYATWGVCRRNVRINLSEGDLVIFFCGKEEAGKLWQYYFIGFGTVKQCLYNREEVWTKQEYEPYRDYYNILVKQGLHHEPFGKEHSDWKKRITAPYVFFETNPALTTFEIESPLLVADCDTTKSLTETWHLSNPLVKHLWKKLFQKHVPSKRHLRIENIQRAHVHIRLKLSEQNISELRLALRTILKERKQESRIG